LHTQGIVSPDFSCREQVAASVLQAPVPEYPRLAGDTRQGAIVITGLTIGVDGLARDPEILLAVPETGFPAAVIEAWLNSRFVPASRDGVPIESRLQAQSLLAVEGGGGLSGWDVYRSARQRADAGDPGAGYLVGLTATLDASLGISSARAGQLLLASARDGDSRAQYWVGSQPGQRFHDLMEQARYTLDPKKRKALYMEATAIFQDEKPSVELFQEVVVYGTSRRVSFKPRADFRLIVSEMTLAR